MRHIKILISRLLGHQFVGTASLFDRVAATGLFLFCLGLGPSKSLSYVGLVVLFVAFVASYGKSWQTLKTDPFFWLLIIFSVYLIIPTAIGIVSYPHDIEHHISDAVVFQRLPLAALLVAWALSANEQRIGLAIKAAFAGILIAIFLPLLTGSIHVDQLMAGFRTGFMMKNPNSMGLYSAAALLGLFLLLARHLSSKVGTKLDRVYLGKLLLLITIMLNALFISQGRTAWLASVIVFPLIGVLWILINKRLFSKDNLRRLFVVILVFGISVSTIGIVYKDTVVERILDEKEAFTAIVSGDNTVPDSSLGIRVKLWVYGFQQLHKHRIFGHGTGSVEHLIRKSGFSWVENASNLHNSYLDVLLRLGIVGFVMVAGFFVLAVRSTISAYRHGVIEPHLFLFLLGAMALYLMDNMTAYQISRSRGLFFFAFIGGIAYTFKLHRRDRSGATQKE